MFYHIYGYQYQLFDAIDSVRLHQEEEQVTLPHCFAVTDAFLPTIFRDLRM